MKGDEPRETVAAIIPARFDSSRFPGKPLHPLVGKPLIQHVYERGLECSSLDRLLIATDDERIREAAEGFGAPVAMTASDHPSGTDRIAEAAASVPEATHVVNIQGDEPLLDAAFVDEMVATLASVVGGRADAGGQQPQGYLAAPQQRRAPQQPHNRRAAAPKALPAAGQKVRVNSNRFHGLVPKIYYYI